MFGLGKKKDDHHHPVDRVGNRSIAVFVHGILGHYMDTWGRFPSLLHDDPALTHYNFRFWGYPSPSNPFYLPFIGHKTPDIAQVANAFLTYLEGEEMNEYVDLVLVGHSMGGLVLRQAVIQALKSPERHEELLARLRQIVLYASPSTGVELSAVLTIHPQARQLFRSSDFITELQADWASRVNTAPDDDGVKFHCPTAAIIGLEDAAVPEDSARAVYETVETVPGHHSEMNKPATEKDASFTLLRRYLLSASPAPLIVGKAEILERTLKIVRDARRSLFITGSRSHNVAYLQEIERKLAASPKLEYHRVLLGPPRTKEMYDHIVRVLTTRPPSAKVNSEQVTFVAVFDDFELQPEIFLCGNERCCIAILPPMTALGEYSTGYYFTATAHVEKYFRLAKEMFTKGLELEKPEEVPGPQS